MQKARMGRKEKEKERNNHLSCVNMRMESRVKLEDEWIEIAKSTATSETRKIVAQSQIDV